MTFPCKEELIELENIEKRQYQIFPDACDLGIRIGDDEVKGISEWVKYSEVLNPLVELRKVYGGKAEKWESGSSFQIFIPIEYETEIHVSGIILKVSMNKTRQGNFFSIDTRRGTFTLETAKKNYGCKVLN